MTTYLLLRNNKESGPYSLEALVKLGLKAYDLIWVEGKSAAWRYPGEVAELKAYAPMVEEQPFDRFYKKPETAKETLETGKQVEKPVETYSSFTPKKSVFVTLPGNQPLKQVPEPVKQTAVQPEKTEPTPVISIKENPVQAETKYSQPLDEIKEMYVKTLQERKNRTVQKAMLAAAMKKAAVIILIAGAGVLIGFSMKSKKEAIMLSSQQAALPSQPVINLADESVQNLSSSEETYAETHPTKELTTSLSAERQEQQPLFLTPEKPVAPKLTAEKKQVADIQEPVITEKRKDPELLGSPGAETNTRTGERNRRTRDSAGETPATETVSQPKGVMQNNDLGKSVTVKSNDYHKVAFGGIRNLQLTVFNDSKYILDNVIVELQYLKPSEEPLRTENIEFRSVSPGGSMTIKVPDSNRGIKVNYKIKHILSTQSAKDLSGL